MNKKMYKLEYINAYQEEFSKIDFNRVIEENPDYQVQQIIPINSSNGATNKIAILLVKM